MPGSHDLSAPTPRARFVDSSGCPPPSPVSATLRRFVRAVGSLWFEEWHRGVQAQPPRIEAEPPLSFANSPVSRLTGYVGGLHARKKGYDIQVGSFESLTFPPDSFDLIFLIQVLEHLSDPRSAVEKIARMLRPGGRVMIETPSTNWSGLPPV